MPLVLGRPALIRGRMAVLGRDLARPREGALVGPPAAQEFLGLGRDAPRGAGPPAPGPGRNSAASAATNPAAPTAGRPTPTSVIRPRASQTAAPAAPIGQS